MQKPRFACRWLWILGLAVPGLGCSPEQEVRPDPSASRPTSQAAQSPQPAVIHAAPWGADPGQFGHLLPAEGAPEGPMSLTTNPQGELLVLDQVNARIQVLSADGSYLRSIPIPTTTVQDLVVGGLGDVVLLDRLAEPGLLFLDSSGKLRARVGVVGHGVAEGASVTGLVEHDGAIWVEVEGQMTVRIADWQAMVDPDRISIEGHPSPSGGMSWLARLRDGTVQLRGQLPNGAAVRRGLSFSLPVRHLTSLNVDEAGNVFVAAHVARESAEPPFALLEDKDILTVLTANGGTLGRVEFEASSGPEEQFRSHTVARDGTVFHLQCTSQGTFLRRWRP